MCLSAEIVCALTTGAITMSVERGALRRSSTTKPGSSCFAEPGPGFGLEHGGDHDANGYRTAPPFAGPIWL